MTLKELRALYKAEFDAAKSIQDAAKAEDRNVTPEELEKIEAHLAKAAETREAITEAEKVEAADKTRRAKVAAAMVKEEAWGSQVPPANAALPDPQANQFGDGSRAKIVGGRGSTGYSGFGEYLFAVRDAAITPSAADPRLTAADLFPSLQAAAPGLLTTVDSEGGFLIPDEQRTTILERVYEMGELIKRCQRIPMSGNTFSVPYINETSRATGSRAGGVRFYWTEEAGTITDSQPKFGQCKLSVSKCAALGYVTEEMMEDAPAAGTLLERLLTDEVTFGVEDAIFRGTGDGMPLGIINAGCKVEISKATNQDADTIWGSNIVRMWARLPSKNRPTSVWWVNQDVEPELWGLTLEGKYTSASSAGIPLYYPANSLMNTGKFGILMGQPVIPVEYASTLGDAGDIVLADLNDYLLGWKGGAKTASSIHVRFLTDERTFRVTMRVDGQPWWSAAVTPYKGSSDLSPIITLADR